MLDLSDIMMVVLHLFTLIKDKHLSISSFSSICIMLIIIFNDCLFRGGQSHLLYWLGTDVSGIMYLLYSQESMMKKKNIKIKVCESCGKPKVTEEMNAFTAVQEAMQYIRINDNHPYMTEELPLYEGKII